MRFLTLHFWVWRVLVSQCLQSAVKGLCHPPDMRQQLGSVCQPHCGAAAEPVVRAKTRTQMQRIMGFIFSLQ